MSELSWHEQPSELTYQPPRYPSHNYQGRGWNWRIVIGDSLVGNLSVTPADPTRPAETVEWDSGPPPDTEEGAISDMVRDMLFDGAEEGRPLPETIRDILDTVQWEWGREVDLAQLASTSTNLITWNGPSEPGLAEPKE